MNKTGWISAALGTLSRKQRPGARKVFSRLAEKASLLHESEDGYFRRMLWSPVAFAAGCSFYFSLTTEPGWTIWGSLLGAIIVLHFAVRRFPVRFRAFPGFIFLLCFISVLGMCYSAFRAHTMGSGPLLHPAEQVMVEGWISEVSGDPDRTRLLIRTHAISGISEDELPAYVRVSQRGGSDIRPGRFARCFATLRAPPEPRLDGDYDFARQAYFDGLGAVGYVLGTCRAGGLSQSSSPLSFDRLNADRRATAARIASSGTPGAGLAAALMTGDRSFLPVEYEEALRGSGLAHLLAISGLHLGLAAGAFFFLFFRGLALIPPLANRVPVQKVASVAAFIGVTFYLLFSGAGISTQRAYIMVCSVLLFTLLDRPVLSFQSLAVALMTVLIISPWSVVTPGFQMSFAATAALISAYQLQTGTDRPLSGKGYSGKVWMFIKATVVTSLVAGLATAPFALYHFGRSAPLGLIANVTVMPIISIVCVPLAVATAITLPLGLEGPSLWLLSRVLDFILWVAKACSEDVSLADAYNLTQMPVWVFTVISIALVAWILHRRFAVAFALPVIAVSSAIWWFSPAPLVVLDGAGHIYAYKQEGWTEIDIGTGGLGPLWFADAGEMRCREGCSTNLGMDAEMEIDAVSGELTLSNSHHEINLLVTEYRQPVAIYSSPAGFSIRPAGRTHCRPWLSSWPSCKGNQ